MAGLAIGLWLLGGWGDRASESFVWLAGRKAGAFCPFAAPPQQGVMDSFQGWLLTGLVASCVSSSSLEELPGPFQLCFPAAVLVRKVTLWVFGISVTSPAPELPRNDTRSGAVKAGTCPQVPLFSLAPHQMEAAALGWGWVEDVCVTESRPSPRQKCWECLSGFFSSLSPP